MHFLRIRSLITWSVVNVTTDINYFRFISLDTIWVSWEEVCLPIVGNLLWGRYLRVIKSDGFVISLWRRFAVHCLDSSPQFGKVCPVVQCLHELSPCVSPMFICCSGNLVVHLLQGERGGISSRALILSNIFAGTGSVLIRCCPEGICRVVAFRMMVRKIFYSFWQFDGIRLLLSLSVISLRYWSQVAFFKLKLV